MLRSLLGHPPTFLTRRLLSVRAQHSKAAAPSTSSDPYPLPLSPQIMQMEKDENFDDLLPSPLPRPNETTSALRARLVYQSRKRGMLEGDLLLSTFAKEQLPIMSVEELKQFDKVLFEPFHVWIIVLMTMIQLLDEADWDIYYWSIDKRQPPERWANSPLLEKLRVHARNEGRVVRVMPDLDVQH